MRYIISYVSTVSANVSNTGIKDLMNFVYSHNNNIGITGILIHSEGNFFQILEGDEETVRMMFERIKKDPRHYNIIKMLDKKIDANSFTEYHTPFTIISSHNSHSELHKFLQKEKINNPEHYESISYLIQKFMNLT